MNIYHSAADAPDVLPANSIVNDCFLEALQKVPDKSIQLIIADPPYYEVKGDFDFIWARFEDYLADVETWAKALKRVLADNGTLFWYGHAKKIAYAQVIFDKYFNLENSLVWEKKECQTMRASPDLMRSFAPVTERILMYSNETIMTGLQSIYSDANLFSSVKKYMRDERDKLMKQEGFITISQFNDFINKCTNTNSVASRHYFADSQYAFPTEHHYKQMQTTGFWQKPYEVLRQEYEVLRQEYEVLRQEYEVLRRPFNQSVLNTDVLKYSQESHESKKYDHPTQKPLGLTRLLIQTTSRKDATVLIPFAGSGTECQACIELGRKFIGIEKDGKHFNDTVIPRLTNAIITQSSKLFNE
jgi:site-specific DNA-methyltransferase (adenine-specific)